jgi:hypothetical protein
LNKGLKDRQSGKFLFHNKKEEIKQQTLPLFLPVKKRIRESTNDARIKEKQ